MNREKKIYQWTLGTLKKIFGVPKNDGLSRANIIKYIRLKYGPYLYKKKYGTAEIIAIMKDFGMKSGSNVFIHSSWNEFYNYTGSEQELIEAILGVIGPTGTLAMPAYPLRRKGRIFNLKKSVTKGGLLAEEFRKYPGVKRSINDRHSVCALGPMADFLLNEHHLGDNCWDEKSPYYKLSQIDCIVFTLGLSKYFFGTMVHCVEGVLWKDYPYFRDMFSESKNEHQYIDYDGQTKSYYCYDGIKRTLPGFFKERKFLRKYIKYQHSSVSNLGITAFRAKQVIPMMIENGRKGVILYSMPSPRGYHFE